MRNVLDKSCRKKSKHTFCVYFFPKIVPLFRQCRKTLYSRTGHRMA